MRRLDNEHVVVHLIGGLSFCVLFAFVGFALHATIEHVLAGQWWKAAITAFGAVWFTAVAAIPEIRSRRDSLNNHVLN